MHPRTTDSRGMTLIEAIASMSIFAFASMGLLASASLSARAAGTTADADIGLRAVRGQVEALRAHTAPAGQKWRDSFFETFSGATFTVDGVRPRGSGGAPGQVVFLTEQQAEAALAPPGTPSFLDLNGNGTLGDSVPPAAGWSAYAVRVSVTFGDRTAPNDRTLESVTVVYEGAN